MSQESGPNSSLLSSSFSSGRTANKLAEQFFASLPSSPAPPKWGQLKRIKETGTVLRRSSPARQRAEPLTPSARFLQAAGPARSSAPVSPLHSSSLLLGSDGPVGPDEPVPSLPKLEAAPAAEMLDFAQYDDSQELAEERAPNHSRPGTDLVMDEIIRQPIRDGSDEEELSGAPNRSDAAQGAAAPVKANLTSTTFLHQEDLTEQVVRDLVSLRKTRRDNCFFCKADKKLDGGRHGSLMMAKMLIEFEQQYGHISFMELLQWGDRQYRNYVAPAIELMPAPERERIKREIPPYDIETTIVHFLTIKHEFNPVLVHQNEVAAAYVTMKKLEREMHLPDYDKEGQPKYNTHRKKDYHAQAKHFWELVSKDVRQVPLAKGTRLSLTPTLARAVNETEALLDRVLGRTKANGLAATVLKPPVELDVPLSDDGEDEAAAVGLQEENWD